MFKQELPALEFVATADLARGWIEMDSSLICLFCAFSVSGTEVYPHGQKFLTARGAIETHICDVHGSAFTGLMTIAKAGSAVSAAQATVLEGWYRGNSDDQIGQALGDKAKSTVRNHKFKLREEFRRARIFSALMMHVVAEGRAEGAAHLQTGADLGMGSPESIQIQSPISLPQTFTVRDERIDTTEQEAEEILKQAFNVDRTRLLRFPLKQKRKVVVLRELVRKFERGRQYSEKEVNEVLQSFYQDYVTLRRYMIEYGFMDRIADGSSYWLR